MQFKTIIFSLLAASTVAAKRNCGTPSPSGEQTLLAQNLLLDEQAQLQAGNSSRLASVAAVESITINVYWHVIASARNVNGGYLAQETLDAQLSVLNDAYAPHNIQFKQAGADWTINTQWANDQGELAMKRQLRKGTYADLNVYFIPGTQYLGYAYFPENAPQGSQAFTLDGVVILSGSVPGGALPEYNIGHTATHEVGHWLGLYHTFEGDTCGGNGDFIDDTPAEAEAAFGCELERDTCPNDPGKDPVTNYMDYSDDACFTGFTKGQETRIYNYWDQFRAQFQL
ncbi:extracellular metalloprotease [Aaosphaeria arxii CBS 175.79]|uniref:Extracellular metalloprotease n=1 Tax=Aaosphaeria arxii CBS 175.79 TaxID=1450172 RepID=A0A6A5XZ54_9PLEO|nr:extracellular metalloprotease [Aaosphaeria arxii CBS 175.79]KAF2018239.1 extracellular metalloprotease [Aaosphaeria arxii CBS 175.79]